MSPQNLYRGLSEHLLRLPGAILLGGVCVTFAAAAELWPRDQSSTAVSGTEPRIYSEAAFQRTGVLARPSYSVRQATEWEHLPSRPTDQSGRYSRKEPKPVQRNLPSYMPAAHGRNFVRRLPATTFRPLQRFQRVEQMNYEGYRFRPLDAFPESPHKTIVSGYFDGRDAARQAYSGFQGAEREFNYRPMKPVYRDRTKRFNSYDLLNREHALGLHMDQATPWTYPASPDSFNALSQQSQVWGQEIVQ